MTGPTQCSIAGSRPSPWPACGVLIRAIAPSARPRPGPAALDSRMVLKSRPESGNLHPEPEWKALPYLAAVCTRPYLASSREDGANANRCGPAPVFANQA